MPLLQAEDLILGYDSRVIVERLNFKVEKGDYLCIVGNNGSGKTTLMRTILGLQDPLGGRITFGDGLKHNEIGYLPQQNEVQKDFPASVEEIVLSGCQGRLGLRPFYSSADKALARENMCKMGIEHLSKKSFFRISGGQKQRVLLARALCATRKVLLLDEPVSGLDPQGTSEMYELIDSLRKEGVTILMISHDIDAALSYASHILHIGAEVFFGTKEEYLESKAGKKFLRSKKEEEDQ
ncbi:MAG: metal ABC transporter ATP-binding protein [Clostridiales bacterium]|nr:metal ABC transporter ATP-binding protein [Clostridiales bacterium]